MFNCHCGLSSYTKFTSLENLNLQKWSTKIQNALFLSAPKKILRLALFSKFPFRKCFGNRLTREPDKSLDVRDFFANSHKLFQMRFCRLWCCESGGDCKRSRHERLLRPKLHFHLDWGALQWWTILPCLLGFDLVSQLVSWIPMSTMFLPFGLCPVFKTNVGHQLVRKHFHSHFQAI